MPARVDSRHRADRDDLGRVRDGRDPVRAARARRGPQCRPLGLHLLDHQGILVFAVERAVLPDRGQVTMAVPFMRAYTQLLVKTCHRRGAHAMGGMSAFIPNRREPEVTQNALAKVREDKEREAGDGFDGTWVAHPDLVPVAMEIFDRALADHPNQKYRQRNDVQVGAADLTNFEVPGGADHRCRSGDQRIGRYSLHRVVAGRRWRGRARQPDGRRGHGRDLALTGLAVAQDRPVLARSGRSPPSSRGAHTTQKPRPCSSRWPYRTTSSSSSPCPHTNSCVSRLATFGTRRPMISGRSCTCRRSPQGGQHGRSHRHPERARTWRVLTPPRPVPALRRPARGPATDDR